MKWYVRMSYFKNEIPDDTERVGRSKRYRKKARTGEGSRLANSVATDVRRWIWWSTKGSAFSRRRLQSKLLRCCGSGSGGAGDFGFFFFNQRRTFADTVAQISQFGAADGAFAFDFNFVDTG